MSIYRFIFAISSYDGDGIFEKHVYFDSDTCPTEEIVREALVKLRDRDAEYPEDIGEYAACLETMDRLTPDKDFPRLTTNAVRRSVQVGTHYIIVEKLIDIVKV